jgi:hypothetical protein
MSNSEGEKLKTYEELCISYRAIDDFRAKLLTLLPLATGGGIFFLANLLRDETRPLFFPIGIFGFVATLGLFSYEIYGIKKCHALLKTGAQLEDSLGIAGQFKNRPRAVLRVINEPFAAGLIYPAVLAAWTFLALVFALSHAAPWVALIVFFVALAGTLFYDFRLQSSDKPSTGKSWVKEIAILSPRHLDRESGSKSRAAQTWSFVLAKPVMQPLLVRLRHAGCQSMTERETKIEEKGRVLLRGCWWKKGAVHRIEGSMPLIKWSPRKLGSWGFLLSI